MPELPEVETVRRTLKNFIIGKKITAIEIYYAKIITGNPDHFAATLIGQTIRDIDRVGKYLIFILDHDAFISHLRMEGKYHLIDATAPRNKHQHLSFIFSDGTALRYQDTRKFGRLELVRKDCYRQDLPLSKLGPEPWDAEPAKIYAKIHKSSLPIKTLLLDQRIMTGIGNIYANEICFAMKLDPRTPGKHLSKKRVAELITVSQTILAQAIAQGGTTIHSFDANGITGLFQLQLNVHTQKFCPLCQGPITKEMVHGRGTYYCQACQKKKG